MGVEGEERFQDEEGMIHDDYRIDFISEHLKWVHQAIQEGSHVKAIICGRLWIIGHGRMPIKIAMDLSQWTLRKTGNVPSKKWLLVSIGFRE